MKSKRISLRHRLLLVLMLPMIVLACLWAVATYVVVLKFINLACDRELEDSVRTLAAQVSSSAHDVSVDLPLAARKMLEYDPDDQVYFMVADSSGHTLVGDHPLKLHLQRPDDQVYFYNDKVGARTMRLAQLDLALRRGQETSIISVIVAETRVKRHILSEQVFSYLVFPQAVMIIAIVALLWHGIGVGLVPLRRIRDAIASRSHLDLSPIDEQNVPAEVHEQVHAINALMARLNHALGVQRRFIADATHQLRTPVAALKAQTELAQRYAEPKDLQAAITRLNASATRLERLVQQLLDLSRAERDPERPKLDAELELRAVLEDVVVELVPVALRKGVDIAVNFPEGEVRVRGDRNLLRVMAANVIDNAVRYTASGGYVNIGLFVTASSVRVEVRDSGTGIPESEQELVFQRFYRMPTTVSEGSGLGLAITREIAVLHGGAVSLSNRADGPGLVVVLVLPSTEAGSPD